MKVKKIHYCWFGNNPKPEIVKNCIESWKKFAPEYEIIEWNETNFDVNCCKYVKEAFESKKFAFVSDYARFKILYEMGGIYVDTDVEFIKSIDDLPDTFVGFESRSSVNSGLIRGAKKGDSLSKEMLDSYQNDSFILEDGSFNLKTICQRETEILSRCGLKLNGENQQVGETLVFAPEYFCPKDYITGKLNITNRTYCIHHYASSWYDEEQKIQLKLKAKYRKIMPKKIADVLATFRAKRRTKGLRVALKWLFKKRRKG